jgi:hypothetical protein
MTQGQLLDPLRKEETVSLLNVQTITESHSASYSMELLEISVRIQPLWCDVEHLPPFNAEIRDM